LSYDFVKAKLARGAVVVLDGGTGTDIQRRGAPMSGDTWCADVNGTHPEIVRAVHDDYIACGADVITANTFATSALSFNYHKRDDDLIALDCAAVAQAKAAAESKRVAVAGSMSTMRPVFPGTDRTILDFNLPVDVAKNLFRRKASNLKLAGVDFIMMEMMRDADYSVQASEAALETGLPVWIGLSVERRADGQLTGFGREDQLLPEFAEKLAALKPEVMCIMHTSPNDTDEAIDVLRQSWSGPIGAYPECGYFKSPDWQFVDVIPPDVLVAKTRDWQRRGASIFGGCCGIGPDHIKALAAEYTR
jgi:S-methylmethionine-dependent homocysteine/selenocysteine methylase